MSCIFQLLKLKGDKPFLATPNESIVMEGGGEYKGYEYIITFTDMGHRCGYVAITSEHPCYGKDLVWGDFDLDVHGGVTFHSKDISLKDLLSHPCNDEWVGFDAAHHNDLSDMALAEVYFGSENDYVKFKKMNLYETFGKRRTFGYMASECKRLIDQLIEVKHEKVLP